MGSKGITRENFASYSRMSLFITDTFYASYAISDYSKVDQMWATDAFLVLYYYINYILDAGASDRTRSSKHEWLNWAWTRIWVTVYFKNGLCYGMVVIRVYWHLICKRYYSD